MTLRDVDSAERMFTIKVASWSLAGLVIGAAVGAQVGGVLGSVVGGPLGFALVFLVARAASGAGAATFGTIYSPSGNSTPAKREYSRPQALEAMGHYDEAIKAYETFCVDFPEDPEPYLRIARLYRNELQRFDDAINWFRKARANAKVTQALELLVTQEIVDVYTHRLAAPQRAMPELARLAERFPGSKAAAWARQRLQELRAELARSGQDTT